MPLVLTRVVEAKQLQHAKVANFVVEYNVEKWIIIYVVWGEMIDGHFVEWFDPMIGTKAPPLRLKIEDGNHPMRDGMALRKCTACGWWTTHATTCGICGEPTVAYDGWTRLVSTPPSGETMLESNANAIYGFLTTETVPHPDTWEEVLLLDATSE